MDGGENTSDNNDGELHGNHVRDTTNSSENNQANASNDAASAALTASLDDENYNSSSSSSASGNSAVRVGSGLPTQEQDFEDELIPSRLTAEGDILAERMGLQRQYSEGLGHPESRPRPSGVASSSTDSNEKTPRRMVTIGAESFGGARSSNRRISPLPPTGSSDNIMDGMLELEGSGMDAPDGMAELNRISGVAMGGNGLRHEVDHGQEEFNDEGNNNVEKRAPPLTAAVDDSGRQIPGAYSAPGRAAGSFPIWGRFFGTQPTPQHRARSNPLPIFQPPRREIRVTDAHVMNAEDEVPRLLPGESSVQVTEILEENDAVWPQKRSILLCLGVLVVTAIAVCVGVPLILSGDADDSSTPPSQDQPTPAPVVTETAAPTIPQITITSVLTLDDKPQETGWWLECERELLFNFTPGTYDARQNKLVTQESIVTVGEECYLNVVDTGGDGIDDGSIEVFLGTDILDKAGQLAKSSGKDFRNETSILFMVPSGTTPSPSLRTTRAPATVTPSPTPVPASLPPVDGTGTDIGVNIVLQFDAYATEIGWSLECNDGTNTTKPPFTYVGESFLVVNEPVRVSEGAQCRFTLTDTEGDGMCCYNGKGSFQVQIGDDDVTIAQGGRIGHEQQMMFRAVPQPADLISVDVEIQLDDFPTETSWTLDCGDVSTQGSEYEIRRYLTSSTIFAREGATCRFIVEDQRGDGNCCASGEGGYQLTIDNNYVVADGGKTGGREEVSFIAKRSVDSTKHVPVTPTVYLDLSPEETRYSVQCGNVSVESSLFGNVENERTRTATIQVDEESACIFIIEDTGGDGICCSNEPGQYELYLGQDHLVAAGGRFGGREEVHFVAAERKALGFVEINAVLTLDDYPDQTSWLMDCGDTFVESSKFSQADLRRSTINVQEGSLCSFTISDTKGDGLCCSTGSSPEGFLEVTADGGPVDSISGNFGFEWTTEFLAGSTTQIPSTR